MLWTCCRCASRFASRASIARAARVHSLWRWRRIATSATRCRIQERGELSARSQHDNKRPALIAAIERADEEVQEVRKSRDAIMGWKDKLITSNLATEDELKAIDKEVRKEVDEATQIATSEGVLPSEALYADLYGRRG